MKRHIVISNPLVIVLGNQHRGSVRYNPIQAIEQQGAIGVGQMIFSNENVSRERFDPIESFACTGA